MADVWMKDEQLDAELLDTLQVERVKRDLPLHVRTAETAHHYPRPQSRATPKLQCPYCGRKRCNDHTDLPALDPYYVEP